LHPRSHPSDHHTPSHLPTRTSVQPAHVPVGSERESVRRALEQDHTIRSPWG
jgi:hypothetical protein